MALFKRPMPAQAVEPEPPAPASMSLTDVPLRDLYLECARRGFQVLPAGVFEATNRELEARLHAAEAKLAQGLGLIHKLSIDGWDEHRRAEHAEMDAQRLAHALVGHEIAELTNNDSED